jgi:hypothetical protein
MHRIYGLDVTPYQAQAAIDRAVAAGEPILLEDDLRIAIGHLNFKGAQVRIEGDVTFTDGVMSVVDASVTWAEGSSLTLGAGAYIHRRGVDTSRVIPDTTLVEYAEGPEDIMPTATAAGVKRFKLGPLQDYDYSVDPNGVNAKIRATTLETLYVLDELIVGDSATVPSGAASFTLTAMGTVDVISTPPNSVVLGVAATLPLGTCSTLTTSTGGVVVPVVPTITIIPNITVDKDFSLQPTIIGTFAIPGKLTGPGTLKVLGAVTEIAIAGGNGNVSFPAADPTELNILSTGTVAFDGPVISLDTASTIAGDVVFGGDVTIDSQALTLNGNVTLVRPAVITLDTAPAAVLILGPNKTLSVRFTPGSGNSLGQPVTAPVLSAGPERVVLTPAAGGVTLTAGPAGAAAIQNTEAGINAAKIVTLADDGLTITSGVLRVAPDAALVVNGQVLTTGDTNTLKGYLAVVDGGSLRLADAASSVETGDTETSITAPGIAVLKAVGGTITLGNNRIAGSVDGAALTVTTGAPVFNVLTPASRLTLNQADLNVAGGSILVNDIGGRVVLQQRAKITLNTGEGGIPATLTGGINRTAGSLATTGFALNGDFAGLTAPNATTNQAVWSVAQQGTGEVSVVANAATLTLNKSARFSN